MRGKSFLCRHTAGSITGGTSNVVGAIGEVIVADIIGATEVNTVNYDLVKDGNRIDVKTKRCNTRPQPNYDCSVASHGTKQDCDSYVFVRILTDLSKAWILGSISKKNTTLKLPDTRKVKLTRATVLHSEPIVIIYR